jgi:hypothetical protein
MGRATLFNNDDFSYTAELTPTSSPINGFTLTISSRCKTARDPDSVEVKFKACLDGQRLIGFADMIYAITNSPRTARPPMTPEQQREATENAQAFSASFQKCFEGGASLANRDTP